MKIFISYPPLESDKGIPLISQNRQFQWFNNPTYIYPIVPAYAATLLKQNGFDVVWDDGIAEELSYTQWIERVKREKPDIIAMETKTPVVKRHWEVIKDLKNLTTDNWQPVTVLMGDHVTAIPEESMNNSNVDFVITGGDYDFLLLNLCNAIKKCLDLPPTFSPSPLVSNPLSFVQDLPPGTWYRENNNIKSTGDFEQTYKLEELPFIDRDLTKWELYAYKNGNFKYTPGTYTMAGRDCWWRSEGGCTFCSWTSSYPKFRVVKPERLLDEIGLLIEKYNVKEIFDDTGTFPIGNWLKEFCEGMISRGYNKKVVFGCNMKPGRLTASQYKLMKKANFRFLLFGMESANEDTLKRLNKGNTVKDIKESVKFAKQAGLEPHLTCMVGYPWESGEDAIKTINLTKELFKCGWVDTLQATIVIPYPGTKLFEECKENNWLITEDWDRYDMRENVMNSPVSNEDVKRFSQELYKSFMSPLFVLRKIISIRNFKDVTFFFRAGKKVFAHLLDFK